MTKHEAATGIHKLLEGLIGKLGTSVYRILSVCLLALICAGIKWYGPQMGHDFVASDASVVQALTDASSAKSAAAEAKLLAASVALDSKNSVAAVSSEVETVKTTQDKMVEALGLLHSDAGKITTALAVQGKVQEDIVSRLDRVERKQDAGHQ